MIILSVKLNVLQSEPVERMTLNSSLRSYRLPEKNALISDNSKIAEFFYVNDQSITLCKILVVLSLTLLQNAAKRMGKSDGKFKDC